jgi:hypothetical protein
MTTLAPSFAPLHTSCGTRTANPHVYNCELDLAVTYLRHNRTSLAMECAWSALNTALAMSRPDLAWDASIALAAINAAGSK